MGGAVDLMETALRPQTLKAAGLALEEGFAAMRAGFRGGASAAVDTSEAVLPKLKMGGMSDHVVPVSIATDTPKQILGAHIVVPHGGSAIAEGLDAVPTRGQKAFVPSRSSDMSPHLDRIGGMATIEHVRPGISAGKEVPFVSFKEVPGISYNWEILAADQARLKAAYEGNVARPDPSFYRPGDGFPRRF